MLEIVNIEYATSCASWIATGSKDAPLEYGQDQNFDMRAFLILAL